MRGQCTPGASVEVFLVAEPDNLIQGTDDDTDDGSFGVAATLSTGDIIYATSIVSDSDGLRVSPIYNSGLTAMFVPHQITGRREERQRERLREVQGDMDAGRPARDDTAAVAGHGAGVSAPPWREACAERRARKSGDLGDG